MKVMQIWISEFARTTDGRYSTARLNLKEYPFDMCIDLKELELKELKNKIDLMLKDWKENDERVFANK